MVSKPSISLLPTAVMRHLHNAKQSVRTKSCASLVSPSGNENRMWLIVLIVVHFSQELASRGSPIMANKLDQGGGYDNIFTVTVSLTLSSRLSVPVLSPSFGFSPKP